MGMGAPGNIDLRQGPPGSPPAIVLAGPMVQMPMTDTYVAKPLARRQIDQAFPVVQTIAPDLGVERWRAFAAAVLAAAELETGDAIPAGSTGQGMEPRGVMAEPRGIMTVQN